MKLEKKEDCDKILTMKISAEDAIYLHFFQKKVYACEFISCQFLNRSHSSTTWRNSYVQMTLEY